METTWDLGVQSANGVDQCTLKVNFTSSACSILLRSLRSWNWGEPISPAFEDSGGLQAEGISETLGVHRIASTLVYLFPFASMASIQYTEWEMKSSSS